MPARTPVRVVCAPAPEATDEVRRAWDRHEAVLLVDPDAPAPDARRQLDALAPDLPVAPGVAAIVATSGTAGEPRGVELTFDGLRASAEAVGGALGVTDADRWLCCLPVHRVAGLAVLARSWA
ncbi:MAG: AMP-binding protein, partial [Acidimicrobiales bacterium]